MTEPTRPQTRLYLITPPVIADVAAFVASFEAALSGGDIASLQVRIKPDGVIDTAATEAVAKALLPVARAHDVALIINDSVEICEKLGADGVHLGASDAAIKDTRKRLGEVPIIGATCGDSRHTAMEAGEAGADYVAFGAFFPTKTKLDTKSPTPEILTWWQELMELPCVAIGGITVETAQEIAAAGADFVAVSSGVWDFPEGPKAAVEKFKAAFARAAAG